MADRRRLVVVLVVLAVLAGASPAPAATEGTMTVGVHVTLVSRWLDPADTEGLITPFMVLYVPPYTALGEAVANYLQAIGIRSRVRTMERASFLASWREKKLRGLLIGATGAAGNAAARVE